MPVPPPPPSAVVPSAQPRRGGALPWVLVAVLTVVAVVLGILLVVGAGGSSGAQPQTFSTPEEAIEFSTERIAEGDAAGALAAWASVAQAENLDLVATLDRMGALGPADATSLPSEDPFFVELAQTSRAGNAAVQYRQMVVSLLLPEVRTGSVTPIDSDGREGDVSAQDVADGLDSARLAGLSAERIGLVEGPDTYDENMALAASLVGADERREYLVLYEHEDETYLGGVAVLRYGDGWQIASLESQLAGTETGTLAPTSAADYEDLLARFADM